MCTLRIALRIAATWCLVAPLAAAELVIPGTGDAEFILARLGEAFEKSHPQHKISIPASIGSTGGVRAVIEKQAILGRIARALKAEEAAAGVKALPFGRDAVVFAVGERVKVASLTEGQLADVFAARKSNWQEVGDGNGPIRLVVREESDTALTLIRGRLGEFRALRFGADAKLVAKTPEMIEMLVRYKTAIGWATYSALQAHAGKVRPLAIGGVTPAVETITSGKYPVTVEYAMIYRESALTAEAREFLAFLANPAAHEVMRRHGVAALVRK